MTEIAIAIGVLSGAVVFLLIMVTGMWFKINELVYKYNEHIARKARPENFSARTDLHQRDGSGYDLDVWRG
jgi:hypothetical protein